MNKKYIPDSKLEWYLLGALPEHEQAEIAALEQSDKELRERIEALRTSDAEILAEYPPSRLAERFKLRYSGVRGNARRPQKQGGSPRWPLSVYICAALLLILPMLIIVVPIFFDTIEDGNIYTIDEMAIDTTNIDNIHIEDKEVIDTTGSDSIRT
jgi:hypothetical protein